MHDVETSPSGVRPPKRLTDPAFDPRRVAILEHPLSESIDPSGGPDESSVEITRNEPNAQQFQVQTTGRGLFIAGEVFYPGWRASVNGQPATIYRADGLLRGVVVPSGASTITFEYRPLSVRIGAVLTLVAAVGTALLGVWPTRHE